MDSNESNDSPHRTSVPATGSTGASSMVKLPAEHQIMVLRYATPSARKALRLIHPSWCAAATEAVFRRIVISKFARDWDNFLNISNTPGLACLVREVCWYETTGDSSVFTRANYYRGSLYPPDHPSCEDEMNALKQTRRLVQDATLVNSLGSTQYVGQSKALLTGATWCEINDMVADVKRLSVTFSEALDRLSGLECLASVPMPGSHTIAIQKQAFDDGDVTTHEVTAAMLDTISSFHRVDINLGFWQFFYNYIRQGTGAIKKLRLVEEDGKRQIDVNKRCDKVCGRRSNPLDGERGLAKDIWSTFTHLTHLDLSLGCYKWKFSHSRTLAAAINSAKNLRVLKLDILKQARQRHLSRTGVCLFEIPLRSHEKAYKSYNAHLADGLSLPHLETLRLAGFDLAPRGDIFGSRITRLLTSHRDTMKDLDLYGCYVPQALLYEMHERRMQLTRFRLTPEKAVIMHTPCPLARGSHLVDYVNGGDPPGLNLDGNTACYCTVDSDFDADMPGSAGEGISWPIKETAYLKAKNNEYLGIPDTPASRSHRARCFFRRGAPVGFCTDHSGDHSGDESGTPRLVELVQSPDDLAVAWDDFTESPPPRSHAYWQYKHHDGREAIGDEPLEYFSDWDSDMDDAQPISSSDALHLDPSGSIGPGLGRGDGALSLDTDRYYTLRDQSQERDWDILDNSDSEDELVYDFEIWDGLTRDENDNNNNSATDPVDTGNTDTTNIGKDDGKDNSTEDTDNDNSADDASIYQDWSEEQEEIKHRARRWRTKEVYHSHVYGQNSQTSTISL